MMFEVMWYGGIVLGSVFAIICLVLFVKNHIPSVIVYLSRTKPVRYEHHDAPEQSGRIPLQVGREAYPLPAEATELLLTVQLQEADMMDEAQPQSFHTGAYPSAYPVEEPIDPNAENKWQ